MLLVLVAWVLLLCLMGGMVLLLVVVSNNVLGCLSGLGSLGVDMLGLSLRLVMLLENKQLLLLVVMLSRGE